MGNMDIGWHGKLIIVKQKPKAEQIIFVIYSLHAFPVIEIKVIHLVLATRDEPKTTGGKVVKFLGMKRGSLGILADSRWQNN